METDVNLLARIEESNTSSAFLVYYTERTRRIEQEKEKEKVL